MDHKRRPLKEQGDGREAGLFRVMPSGIKTDARQLLPLAFLIFLIVLTGCGYRITTPPLSAGPTDIEEGLIAYEEKAYGKALAHFEAILERDPKNIEAHFYRGVIFQRQNEKDKAIAAYREVLLMDPHHYKTHYNLGHLYAYEKSDHARAIDHYRRFLELAPTHPFRHHARTRLAALTDAGEEGAEGPVAMEAPEDADGVHLTRDITTRWTPPPGASDLSPSPPPLPSGAPHPVRPPPVGPASPPPASPATREPAGFPQVACIRGEKRQGSGFVIAPSYILTAGHGVDPVSPMTVHFYDGSSFPGDVLSVSNALDLALIQAPFQGIQPLPFSPEGTGSVGETIRSLGCPLGFSHSVSQGIISAPERYLRGWPVLQTDAAVNPGNSGGPVLNNRGEVIGVILGLFPEARGIAFALPGREAKRFLGKTFFQMGTRMTEAKRYPEAVHLLEQSLFFWPQSAKTHNNLGEAYRQMKDVPHAEQAYTRALELDPNYPDGHFNLGILYDTLLPNPKQATYHYRRYLDLASGSPDAAQVRRRLTALEGQTK